MVIGDGLLTPAISVPVCATTLWHSSSWFLFAPIVNKFNLKSQSSLTVDVATSETMFADLATSVMLQFSAHTCLHGSSSLLIKKPPICRSNQLLRLSTRIDSDASDDLSYTLVIINRVSSEWLLAWGPTLGICRVPKIGPVLTDLISDIRANFSRFVTKLPAAFHRILSFACVKFVPVPFVPPAERYLLGCVGPTSFQSYRCIVLYMSQGMHQDVDSFESDLDLRLANFIHYDWTRALRDPENPTDVQVKQELEDLMAAQQSEKLPRSGCGAVVPTASLLELGIGMVSVVLT
ncbi:hypothetical protein E3N88_03427 [Mikania micrantha]|uniref:K+ potassium transporter C-terminal domain-containing protein n=1 Tax=Mikania micrantha TaxID=192012 RepID=A0A5N6Q8T3_9ASTR|nr:hypothetical protein E3N88_03427 [Mikania micrantha]